MCVPDLGSCQRQTTTLDPKQAYRAGATEEEAGESVLRGAGQVQTPVYTAEQSHPRRDSAQHG